MNVRALATQICSNATRLAKVKPAMESEAQLLARCRRGEATAWDELFDRHYAAAGRFVFQLASDFTREDVEEVCQEVFLSVIRNLHTFHGDSQFQTWLFRIAANKARDFGHHLNRRLRKGSRAFASSSDCMC